MTPAEIIQELFEARKCNGMLQSELGKIAGYNQTTFSRAETGQRAPNLRLMCDWAEALGYELVVRPKS